jgi:hypothetical protein
MPFTSLDLTSNLCCWIVFFQEATGGLVAHHKEDLRKRLAQMSRQKDELHEGDKALALKENDIKWQTIMEEKMQGLRKEEQLEKASEIDAIKRECEKTIQDLTTQVKNYHTTCEPLK